MNNVLFTRNMRFMACDGNTYPCSAKFSTPVFVSDFLYETQFQLIGFGNETVFAMRGFDPMQSLLMAMYTAGEIVKQHYFANKLDVKCLGNFGFPVMLPPAPDCNCDCNENGGGGPVNDG